MIQLSLLLLSAVILFIQLTLFTTAFSTTTVVSVTSSSRPVPIIYAQKSEDISAGEDKHTTDANPMKDVNSSNDKAAMIFLHGLGDSPDGWESLVEALPNLRPSLAKLDMTYVFPPAQMVGITVNGGEKMPGWFDVFDWPIGVEARDDPKGLAMSVKRVEKIVTELKEQKGIDPSRVVLGGFSQGGAVALMASYNRRKKDAIPFAGCICMSGWLPMKDYLDVSEESAAATPLFWAHGQYDDKILFEQQMYGVNKLESEGVDVTAYSYPVGHESSNFEEIDDMAGFLESILCPQPQTRKVQKSAQVDKEAAGSVTDDDETNALLYYLCAIGIDESIVINGSIPSVSTVP